VFFRKDVAKIGTFARYDRQKTDEPKKNT